jgi:hypothetical protein
LGERIQTETRWGLKSSVRTATDCCTYRNPWSPVRHRAPGSLPGNTVARDREDIPEEDSVFMRVIYFTGFVNTAHAQDSRLSQQLYPSDGVGALVNTEDEFHFEAQSSQKPSFQFSTRKRNGWGAMLQAGRSRVRDPMRWIFFNLPNPFSRTRPWGLFSI